MKKSFVYLIVVLAMATMLCACGADDGNGVIGASPKPSNAVDIIPSVIPEVSSSMIPSPEASTEPSADHKSPQVGEREGTKSSPDVGENSLRK